MKYPSKNIPAGTSFLDLVYLVDRVQKTAGSHLLDEHDLHRAYTWATDTFAKEIREVRVEVFGGYSYLNFKYPSTCTHLYLQGRQGTVAGGIVRRMIAQAKEGAVGSRYFITLEGVHADTFKVPQGITWRWNFYENVTSDIIVLQSKPACT